MSQSAAILTGIGKAKHENLIFLDGDLQNDPKDLIKMVKLYTENENVIVHGYRKFRKDPFFRKVLPRGRQTPSWVEFGGPFPVDAEPVLFGGEDDFLKLLCRWRPHALSTDFWSTAPVPTIFGESFA